MSVCDVPGDSEAETVRFDSSSSSVIRSPSEATVVVVPACWLGRVYEGIVEWGVYVELCC